MWRAIGQFVAEGGWGMLPIGFVAAVVAALIAERLLVLFAPRPDPDALIARVRRAAAERDEVSLALRVCARADSPASRVVRAGLLAADAPREHAATAVALALAREHTALARRTPYLPALANIALYLGLLGTLTGLVTGFGCVGGHGGGPSIDPGKKAELLAGGISEAMHCNAVGLGVAVFAVVATAVLSRRATRLGAELDLIAQSTLTTLDALRAEHASAAAQSRAELRPPTG